MLLMTALREIARSVRSLARRLGYDIVRYDVSHDPVARRIELIRRAAIDVVIDVGANDGPYAAALRSGGFRGRIVSFEPQEDAYARLVVAASSDPLWETYKLAVAATPGRAVLHVAGNSSSSSLLPMSEQHAVSAPESRYVGELQVDVASLNSLGDQLVGPAEHGYLKVDVQGAELEVLRGAEGVLSRMRVVEVELSLATLYEGGAVLSDVVAFLERAGFVLLWLDPVFIDPASGQLLQVDGVFARPSDSAGLR
jgi:FkbM family methyltransferase